MSDSSFRPSWQNLFFDRIRGGRLPAYLSYILMFAGIVFLTHLVPWIEGGLPRGQIDFGQFNLHIWTLFIFFSFDFFLRYSASAIQKFGPALDIGEEEFQKLAVRFTHLTRTEGWVTTGVAILFSIPGFSYMYSLSYLQTGISRVVALVIAIFLFSLVFAFFYNVLRQEVMISHLYGRVKKINIFHLEPLYAFSGMTYRFGLFSIMAGVMSYLTNVTFVEGTPQIESFIFFTVINTTLAIASFFLPLLGIHARLVEEKERVSYENNQRIDRTYKLLHSEVDKDNASVMGSLNDQVAALFNFRKEIEAVPTWPWNPGTLRSFISALLLPIVLWLIQGLLSRVVSF